MKFAHYAIAVAGFALVVLGVAELPVEQSPPDTAPTAPPPPKGFSLTPARVVHAAGTPKGLIIYFSGKSGWDRQSDHVALNLSADGYAVIGIDSPTFLAALEQADISCIHPVQPLIALAQRIQRDMGWPVYRKPALAGHGMGGTVVYATIAQAVPGMFLGGISYDYDGFVPGEKPWCSVNGYDAARVKTPVHGWHPGATRQLPTPWRLLLPDDPSPALAKLLAATPNTRILPAAGEAAGIDAALEPLLSRSVKDSDGPQPLTVASFHADALQPREVAA